ncbi:M13-type metalloendopeptidase [Anaerovibrio lipolyticus]|uniref:M13-type metalloendopeptidase n=1 Tax=Anaerovibrio lipolyticus TaxID=82374 RepID=UPI0006910A8F|nr:M13 family metallopeptidase [Anaerovibrio lipolyticus]
MVFVKFKMKLLALAMACAFVFLPNASEASKINDVQQTTVILEKEEPKGAAADAADQKYVSANKPIADGGSPWMDVSVIDKKHEVPSFSAKDNFYSYNNDYWIKQMGEYGISSSYDVFNEVNSKVDYNIANLLETPSLFSHDASICQKVYRMVKDWNRRDKIGLKPLMDDVNKIEAIQTLEDMDNYIIGDEVPNSAFCEPDLQPDLNDTKHYAMNIIPMGFTLGDAAEYSNMTVLGRRIKKANDVAAKKMMLLAKYDEETAKAKIEAMYRLEYALAGSMYTREEASKAEYLQKTNNPVTLDELREMAGRYPIMAYLNKYGLDQAERFSVPNPAYIKALAAYYNEEHLQDMKDTLIVYRMLENMEMLNSAANDVAMEHNLAVRGYKGRVPDWVRGVEYVKAVLPGPLSNLYAEAYCSKEVKQDIEGIIADVTNYYRAMLQNEAFLSPEVRQKAITKLDNLKIRAVMPDKPKKWNDIKLNKCKNLIDVRNALLKWEIGEYIKKMNGEVEINWIPTYTVNAMYNIADNSINIPAGILNGVFYYSDYSYEEKMGGIGMIIAHEISHGFDTTGSQFDENGNMKEWWTPEDKAAFNERAKKVVDYLNSITVYEGLHCNGEINKGETIADIGGMQCILSIAKNKPDFNYKQFFNQYGKLWQSIYTKEYGELQVNTDPHPLPYLRVNVILQQFDKFNETYDIKPGDKMYLAPEKRILVW